MKYTVAIEVGDEDTAYGVTVPDIPGCFSAGDSFEEALENAKEAINGHLEILAEDGELPPKASAPNQLINGKEYAGYIWAVVEIDIEPFLGKSQKVNVTLPNLTLHQIDEVVSKNPAYKSRSHFLQVASMHELQCA
ncbi:type II toxin-antitoxin system HicB family antitoxin [Litoribacillus peritrichatus]|uniref:Type II toxin-antitoxin system HicB family antitoxin n=1 Tax=Litoribacillus peritrichatus TaxID=718191 RepID=A0ABP7MME5_9GAMM